MHSILSFLISHFRPIWQDGSYRISGSENSRVNGGNAFVVVESAKLRLRFVVDRGQLMLAFQSPYAPKDRWFGAALLWRVLRQLKPESDLLDAHLAELVIAELSLIEQMMVSEAWFGKYEELERAEKQRSFDLFGG